MNDSDLSCKCSKHKLIESMDSMSCVLLDGSVIDPFQCLNSTQSISQKINNLSDKNAGFNIGAAHLNLLTFFF